MSYELLEGLRMRPFPFSQHLLRHFLKSAMKVFLYDQSFEGLLTCVFEAYRQKCFPDQLLAADDILPLLAEHVATIQTNHDKAMRVWRYLERKLSPKAIHKIVCTWLSELPGSDMRLFKAIRKFVDSPVSIESNFADDDILTIRQIAKKVNKERLRIIQFARFQETTGAIYFAAVNPAYNILPLTIRYFQDRFAGQQWILYDVIRHYGYYYDLKAVTEITLDQDEHFEHGQLKQDALTPDEPIIQALWRKYFDSLTIKERLNPKLQRQFMPKRFWSYLTEKQIPME